VEANGLSKATEKEVENVLYEEIFVWFGIPRDSVTYQGTWISSKLIQSIAKKYQIRLTTSTSYHLQANGQVEVTNNDLDTILTKTIQLHLKYWAEIFFEALWA